MRGRSSCARRALVGVQLGQLRAHLVRSQGRVGAVGIQIVDVEEEGLPGVALPQPAHRRAAHHRAGCVPTRERLVVGVEALGEAEAGIEPRVRDERARREACGLEVLRHGDELLAQHVGLGSGIVLAAARADLGMVQGAMLPRGQPGEERGDGGLRPRRRGRDRVEARPGCGQSVQVRGPRVAAVAPHPIAPDRVPHHEDHALGFEREPFARVRPARRFRAARRSERDARHEAEEALATARRRASLRSDPGASGLHAPTLAPSTSTPAAAHPTPERDVAERSDDADRGRQQHHVRADAAPGRQGQPGALSLIHI